VPMCAEVSQASCFQPRPVASKRLALTREFPVDAATRHQQRHHRFNCGPTCTLRDDQILRVLRAPRGRKANRVAEPSECVQKTSCARADIRDLAQARIGQEKPPVQPAHELQTIDAAAVLRALES
jgi:hypothetical protein